MKPTSEHIREALLRLLSEFSPLSHWDVAELAWIKPKTAYLRLWQMWDAKILHIAHWQPGKGRGRPTPFYAIGGCEDATRPKPLDKNDLQRAYRSTKHGADVRKRHEAVSNAKTLKRRQTDPVYAEKIRRYQREWAARKHGTQPQALRSVALLDEIAMQFGITWRFAGRKHERKAA